MYVHVWGVSIGPCMTVTADCARIRFAQPGSVCNMRDVHVHQQVQPWGDTSTGMSRLAQVITTHRMHSDLCAHTVIHIYAASSAPVQHALPPVSHLVF